MKPSKTFLFLTLLVLSRSSFALSTEETCLAKSIYYECREEAICKEQDWINVESVAYNRQLAWETWHFGAKSDSLCDIVASREYTSYKFLAKEPAEKTVYLKIKAFLQVCHKHTEYLFFSTKGKGKHRKMIYRGNLMKLIGARR